MLTKAVILNLALIWGAAGPGEPGTEPPGAEDAVVEVRMVEKSATQYVFEPASLEVERGTVVRFVQAGVVPHNVEFKDPPEKAELGEARMGPFLLQPGETYEITIDERFVEGEYPFVCTPHEAMGMTGTLTVTSRR